MNKRINTILLSTILLLLIAGPIIYFTVFHNADKEDKEKTIDEIIASSYDVTDITTNLADGGIIQLSIRIEANDEDGKDEVEKRSFQINNVLIKHLSSLKGDDLSTSEGKSKLEEDLKGKFNEVMKDGKIEKVYITSIIIQ